MTRLRRALARIAGLFAGRAADAELEEELRTHLEMATAENLRRGMSPEEARRRATLDSGGLTQAAEAVRAQRGLPVVENLAADARYSFRALRRRPGFVAAVVATLAGGIGAATAMFVVLDAVVLRPLPYPDSERLVVIGTVAEEGQRFPASAPGDVPDWARTRVVEAVAASRRESRVVHGPEGEPEGIAAAGVSAGFFRLLGVSPALGRDFLGGEDRRDAPAVAILSYGFWQRRFGGDRGVVGHSLDLDGTPFTVVGVMGPSFQPPEAIGQREVSVWYPIGHIRGNAEARDEFFVQAIGRLSPGTSLDQARTELRALGSVLSAEHPEAPPHWPVPESLRARTVGDVETRVVLMSGAIGLLFVMACANVASLFLAHAAERDREMAVRAALGASRGRIGAQLLVESLLLGLIAGLLAVGVAQTGVSALRALGPADLPRLGEMALRGRDLAFALLLTLGASLVFGLIPVRRATAGNRLLGAIQRAAVGHTSDGGASRFRGALVIGQTAVSLVLLVAGGLLARSAIRLTGVDPGFDPRGVAWLDVRITSEVYSSPELRQAFFRDALDRIRAIPGVTIAGGANALPLSPNQDLTWVTPEGLQLRPDETPPVVTWHEYAPGTLEALRVRVLRGRGFIEDDGGPGAPVALVNATFARMFWPERDPVGRTVSLGRDRTPVAARVVGVVDDVRQALDGPPAPEVYVPFDGSRGELWIVAHTDGDPGRLAATMRGAVRALDPSLPLDAFGTLASYERASIAQPRFYAGLVAAFAGLGLLLAMVGIYGTTALAVERRTREAGIRIALGARAPAIVALLVRRAAALTGAGLLLGLAGALAERRILEGFLFGVSPADPLTLGGAVALLGALGLLAAWLPARRAASLDPAETLRAG